MNESETHVVAAPRTSRRYNAVSAVVAFVLWGGWAYYVNSRAIADGGEGAAWVSGLTQGTGSFVITLLMVRAVTWLYQRLPANWVRLVLPAVIVVCVTGTCLATAHAMVGTAEIIPTIAPGLSVALVFNVFTAHQLSRTENSQIS